MQFWSVQKLSSTPLFFVEVEFSIENFMKQEKNVRKFLYILYKYKNELLYVWPRVFSKCDFYQISYTYVDDLCECSGVKKLISRPAKFFFEVGVSKQTILTVILKMKKDNY